jgi:RNA polymerase sigma factor (TIGR02999 family)
LTLTFRPLKRESFSSHDQGVAQQQTMPLTARRSANRLKGTPEGARNLMLEDQGGQVTELLRQWVEGDEKALDELLPVVYKELRRLAHYHLQSERPDHTLQSTALVHEVYLRLFRGQPKQYENRAHFIAVASRLMRQVLVDYARERKAGKRDGGCRIAVDFLENLPMHDDAELLALDDALNELARIDERQGKIVEMKFFGGLSAPEISQAMGLSRATVDREWATARVWLHRQMSRTAAP